MFFKVAITFSLLSILFSNCHPLDKKVTSEDIELINLKSIYSKTEKFTYQIINNTESNYEYYVGLEAFFNNSWNEVIIDVDTSAPDKSAILKYLLPQQVKKESAYLINYFTLDTSMINSIVSRYRFVLNFRLKKQIDFNQKHSKEFLVN